MKCIFWSTSKTSKPNSSGPLEPTVHEFVIGSGSATPLIPGESLPGVWLGNYNPPTVGWYDEGSIDFVFTALTERKRRRLLTAVHENSPVEYELRDEFDAPELIHNHLPMLEECGFIEWTRDVGTVSKGPEWGEIEPLLELLDNHSHEFPQTWP